MHPSDSWSTRKLFHFCFFFGFACVFLAKHFNIFSVFPTKSKARRGIETTKITNLELGGDDTAGRGEEFAGGWCWWRAVRQIQVSYDGWIIDFVWSIKLHSISKLGWVTRNTKAKHRRGQSGWNNSISTCLRTINYSRLSCARATSTSANVSSTLKVFQEKQHIVYGISSKTASARFSCCSQSAERRRRRPSAIWRRTARTQSTGKSWRRNT